MQPPIIKFLGHAGFLLTYNNTKLLCDPWLSESGAFLHSWHQFPPNDFIDKSELYDANFIYLSHNHFDHFDKEFLKKFPKEKVTIIIANFLSDFFYNEIKDLGFSHILRLEDWEEQVLGEDFSVTLIKDPSLYKIDSVAIIKAGGKTVVDKNDCNLPQTYYQRIQEMDVDILFAQFSGAMWYPAAYDYDEAAQRQHATRIKRNLQNNFIAIANGIEAKHVMHCAGPPCFLEDKFFKFNFRENGIFPDQKDAFEYLANNIVGKLHLLLPGDIITPDGDDILQRQRTFDFSRKEEFLRQHQEKKKKIIQSYLAGLPKPEPNLMQHFREHLQGIFSSNEHIRNKVNALIKFTLVGPNGGSICLDLREQRDDFSVDSAEKPNYEFILETTIAQLLVDEKERWEDVFLSMRFQARRNPDVYNWPLFALLQFGKEANLIARIEQMMKENEKETIIIRDKGKQYRIQRYCPHAGEDLSKAKIVNGKIVCPRHHWTFDLNCGGKCIFGGNMPLKIYEEKEEEAV